MTLKNYLAFIAICMSTLSYAQPLAFDNTCYEIYEDGELVGTVSFSGDTLYSELNGFSYPSSTISYTDMDFTIVEIGSNPFCGDLVGTYTYALVDGILDFTLIVDSCDARAFNMTSRIWIACTTNLPNNGIEGLKLAVYPNPVQDELLIETQSRDLDKYLSIRSLDGKAVRSIQLVSDLTRIPVADLVSGVYLILLQDSEGSIRFVKE